jgi:hypothetical protein
MEGQNQIQTIQTNEGTIRIENLGIITGQYLSPNTPSQIAIFKGYPNMYDLTQINSIIHNDIGATYSAVNYNGLTTISGSQAYSTYWYGPTFRWADNKHPAAFGPPSANTLIAANNYGGWITADEGSTKGRNPIKPVIGSSDKASLPEDKRSFLSLTEYIQSKNIQNLAETIFREGSIFQKVSFIQDTNGQAALKLEIPWSAYGTPQVNIRIPTELADTFVERPIITDTKVSAVWETTGSKNADLTSNQRSKLP